MLYTLRDDCLEEFTVSFDMPALLSLHVVPLVLGPELLLAAIFHNC